MTNEEIKNALFSGCQVEHNGIIYKCVSAIIYRLREGKLLLQAELLDKNCNSVIIADASRVKEVIL